MYPYPLLNKNITLFPIFWSVSSGKSTVVDYSCPDFLKVDSRNMRAMDAYNTQLLQESSASWALWGYLEDRSHILTGTHIREEWRVYHLGVDVLFPSGTSLYNPLDGEIYESWYEPGDGNYGGYIIIKYTFGKDYFYALFWHLSPSSITKKLSLKQGEIFAHLWEPQENGNWFPHLHLQIFTGKDIDIWKNRGYCSAVDVPQMRYICPDPHFLIRY